MRTPAYTHTLAHHHPILAFEDVRVPAAHLVGDEGDGMPFAYEWFRFERLMIAARCSAPRTGWSTRPRRSRRSGSCGGEPLIERQLVQVMLADSLTELFAARGS